jgi:Family of unknown function (DUF7033)
MKNDGLHVKSSVNPLPGHEAGVLTNIDFPKVTFSRTSDCTFRLNGNIRITTQARQYAALELFRRAGVPLDFFRTWKVSHGDSGMIFEIPNGTKKQISFPYAPPDVLRALSEGRIATSRARWLGDIHPPGAPDDLIVPFVQRGGATAKPLFSIIDQDTVECTSDLPLAALLMLSRWEETLEAPRDIHGRFAASSSIAARDNFLDRPVVDECALALEQVMQVLVPSWPRKERPLRVKITVDADHVGIPFRWKNALRHTTHYRSPLDSGRDLLGWMHSVETPNLRALRESVLLISEHNLKPSVYWKASPPGSRDSGYDPRDYRVRRVIDWLTDQGVESGVQPGYATFRSPERLRREVAVLREVLGDVPLGGRQHYLRWCPDTWIHWESCELLYDSSVGYADRIGFRAGTCIPYRPWLLSVNRQADLLEIPLIMMDRTLLDYMHLRSEELLVPVLTSCVDRCRAVGGVLSVVWHNNLLLDPLYRSAFMKLLGFCSSGEDYDWQTDYQQQV